MHIGYCLNISYKHPSSSQLGGKHKISHFYPKISDYHIYFWEENTFNGKILLYDWVNYEV